MFARWRTQLPSIRFDRQRFFTFNFAVEHKAGSCKTFADRLVAASLQSELQISRRRRCACGRQLAFINHCQRLADEAGIAKEQRVRAELESGRATENYCHG